MLERKFIIAIDFDGTIGTKDVGTLSIYAKNASAIDGGVAKASDLLVYCPSGGYLDGTKSRGFATSTVTGITLVFNDTTNKVIRMAWGYMNKSYVFTADTSTRITQTSDGSGEQTFTATETFLGNKSKQSGCSCLYIDSSAAFDIISLTITYTCN